MTPKSRGRYEKNRVPCTVSRDETRTHFMHAHTLVQIDDKEYPFPKEMNAQGDQKCDIICDIFMLSQYIATNRNCRGRAGGVVELIVE